MNTIWKYILELKDIQDVKMPFGANVLNAQLQDGKITLWAKVQSFNSPEPRRFIINGTGHELNDEGDIYIGTVQQLPFVWHIFERPL